MNGFSCHEFSGIDSSFF